MYLWVKAAHIIFIVAWMASLLIYPRYKIHQLSSSPGEVLFDTMKDASARLRRVIMLPSMMIVWVLGISLIGLNPTVFSTGIWMWIKLILVIAVTGLQIYYSKLGKAIDAGEKPISPTKLKLLNELPFIALIAIVVLVVVKPI